MFPNGFFPAGYFPPNYWPKAGAETRAGHALGGIRQQMALAALADAHHDHMARVARVRLAREAAARRSFNLVMVRLRELEEEARREIQVQRSAVAAVLAEV